MKRIITLSIALIMIMTLACACGGGSSSSGNGKTAVAFTNKFGTATTKCAHKGCSNYIASSGDTNCCTTHSRKCLECGCYIDEDAMYCMDCIEKAIKN